MRPAIHRSNRLKGRQDLAGIGGSDRGSSIVLDRSGDREAHAPERQVCRLPADNDYEARINQANAKGVAIYTRHKGGDWGFIASTASAARTTARSASIRATPMHVQRRIATRRRSSS
jgi:hypothetical protein